MFDIDDLTIKALRDNLLGWFRVVARPLPWRSDRTLYGTWIAETMLQQTTVAVVEGYWLRFLARFPSVRELAQADEQEVLAMWSGLGYYRRARHLHRAARQVMAQGGGLPDSQAGWAELPGVGPYASGAIASQALGERVPALDANARRVLTRWLVGHPDQLDAIKPRDLARTATQLVPATDPGLWNEAMMELGALVCGARRADCDACPVLDHCRAGLAGMADQIPQPTKREAPLPVEVCLLILRDREGVWLVPATGPADLQVQGREVEPVRSDFSGLHHGMLGLPTTVWYAPHGWPFELGWTPESPLARRLTRGDVAPDLSQARECGRFPHAITRYRLTVRVFVLDETHGELPVAPLSQASVGLEAESGFVEEIFKEKSLANGQFKASNALPGKPLTGMTVKALNLVPDNFS
jgi:A/G-specific adenine glycosylase